MRDREAIEKAHANEPNVLLILILEVLLDIRDNTTQSIPEGLKKMVVEEYFSIGAVRKAINKEV